jgi:deoxycytidylate deaminase
MLEILHHVDHIPYINQKKKKHGNGNAKSFVRLRQEIQRNGLVLAKHAEENALNKYNLNIGNGGRKAISKRKLHVVVIRIDSNYELTESKPCSHCAEVMRLYGIRKVTYSTRNGNLITEHLNLIVTHSSVGYRSVERAINILDEMINFNSTGIG